LHNAIGAAVLGTSEFIERITENHLNKRRHEQDLPALRQLISRPTPEQILKAVEKEFGSNKKLVRQAGMYLCHRYSGKDNREIGEFFGVGPSAITEAGRRFQERIDREAKLAKVIHEVRGKFKI